MVVPRRVGERRRRCAKKWPANFREKIAGSGERKEGELNPQERELRPLSKRVPSPVGLPFRQQGHAGRPKVRASGKGRQSSFAGGMGATPFAGTGAGAGCAAGCASAGGCGAGALAGTTGLRYFEISS